MVKHTTPHDGTRIASKKNQLSSHVSQIWYVCSSSFRPPIHVNCQSFYLPAPATARLLKYKEAPVISNTLLTRPLTANFPSSAAFDVIASSLANDEAGRKDAIKKGGAIFAFELKNKAGEKEEWYIDLKESGTVNKGKSPKKASVTLSLSDEDFGKLVAGKANAQNLFMSGKLKVKGDVMKATKMEPILKKAQTGPKL